MVLRALQACPAPPAEITGVITPDLIIGPAAVPPAIGGQGIEPGAFDEIVAAIRAGYGLCQRPLSPSGRLAKFAASCIKQLP